MQNVVLHYFPIKGLGEGIRMLLSYGGQDFEDHRIPFDQWPAFKPKTPFGQVPVLEADGKTYSQSLAIGRLLGRKYGLAGENLEEAFRIDENMDFFNDIRAKSVAHMSEQDEEFKKKIKEANAVHVTTALKKLDEIIAQNKGYIANGKLSWGDFIIAGIYDTMKNMLLQMPDMDEKYPNIKKLRDNVLSLPKIQEYVKTKAPKSEM